MQSRLISVVVVLGLCLGAAQADAQKIYKTVDKDGNVVFTDVPPRDDTQALKMEEYSTYTPVRPAASPVPAARSGTISADDAEEATDEPTRYDAISIASPADDEAIRQNAGMVSVTVNTTPSLDTEAGHRLQVLLDGVVRAEGAAMSVVLENVDRGSHQVTARVTDAEGNVLAASSPSTFHLQRHSVLLPPKTKPAPASGN